METDGEPEYICVPVNPGGTYLADGPGGKTWGLTKLAPGTWQVSPSINVLGDRDATAGMTNTQPSIWHQTPTIEGVPDGEPWTNTPA